MWHIVWQQPNGGRVKAEHHLGKYSLRGRTRAGLRESKGSRHADDDGADELRNWVSIKSAPNPTVLAPPPLTIPLTLLSLTLSLSLHFASGSAKRGAAKSFVGVCEPHLIECNVYSQLNTLI